jgi:integrase
MKAGKEHRVPLSLRACEILAEMMENRQNDFVFPGMKLGRPLSQMTLAMLLRRIGYGHVTTHGFRSSFRDWAAECTAFTGEVAEMALAHSVSNAVEAAYRRSDMLEKRRQLMNAWGAFCDGESGVVVSLSAKVRL